MEPVTLLRRLAEQQSYAALREACIDADRHDPAVPVLDALAAVGLGDTSSGRRVLESIDCATLDVDARVDVAAVHIALGEIDAAAGLLEADVERHADHALLLARLGWCRSKQGQSDRALELYERSLAARPCMAVYHNLLRLYRESGRLADLARCLDEARKFWATEEADWPVALRCAHSRHLRRMQLDCWLALEQPEAAESWIERQRDVLGEDDWCALLADFAELLVSHDRHAEADEWLRVGLRRYPDNVALIDRAAALAELGGRTRQAIALLRQAIGLATTRREPAAAPWLRLANVALPIDPGLAREAAERARADGGEQGRVKAELALAAIEAQEAQYGAAEQRYRALLDDEPSHVGALEGLGRLHMELGRIDDAIGMFERVRALDPTRGAGALLGARRFPRDEDTLRRLEALARTPSSEGSVNTALLFQLAAAWEEREEFERAFALAEEANSASRRLLRYDPAAHRRQCARIRHAFPRALYEHRRGCGHDSALPVFVVGMPRSGTTLVEQILAGHSRIHGAGELGTMPRVIAGLERWERHTGSGRRYPDCVDDLDPRVTRGIAESVLEEIRKSAPDAQHVVDKLPHNFENVGLIRLLFPRAKVISVRRDPRDIAISNYFLDYRAKHRGMGFAYALQWIGEQLADHARLMRHWHAVFPGEILEIRYEDIVDDPVGSARTLLDYIGVDWEPQVLDFHSLTRPVKTASLWQVRQPLYTSAKGRWRRYERHLRPLIDAMSAPIPPEKVEMVTLPQPGWLNAGADLYRDGHLDAAEDRFKRLLHYVPEHAAARFMLGLVYVRKGHRRDGIRLMELAVERCPWNRAWRDDLARAREATSFAELTSNDSTGGNSPYDEDRNYLRESTCSSAVSGSRF
jgi:tetratricopeptide (TPR) repeat protein